MTVEQIFPFGQRDVAVYVSKGVPYFRAIDVTCILEYKNSSKTIRTHVPDKYTKTKQELDEETCDSTTVNVPNRYINKKQTGKSPLYICEPGVYALAFRSNQPHAIQFREWVFEVVLPQIRMKGMYARKQQMFVLNETDLHYKVIEFIRRFWMEANIVAGLGELQDTSIKRIDAWRKGYTKGQPDILILNRTRHSSGLAIELKTPLGCGVTSPNQREFLDNLEKNNYDTFVSNDYDEIVVRILEYRVEARRCIARVKA